MIRMRIDAVLPDFMGVNSDGELEMLLGIPSLPSTVVLAISRRWSGASDKDYAFYRVDFVTTGKHVLRNHWCRMWWPVNGILYLNVAPFEPRVDGGGAIRVGRVLSRPSLDTQLATNFPEAAHAESCSRSIVLVLDIVCRRPAI